VEAQQIAGPPVVPPSDDELDTGTTVELSESEKRARRTLILIAVAAGLLLIALIVLLVFLGIDAYQAALDPSALPSRSSVVVAVLRDAAIVFVAFQALIIGVLLIILMAQVQSLLVLLRDEIKPMLEAINETAATVRGTTQFVSHNVVSPVMRWSGYLAGLRRMARDLRGLGKTESD
jgi:hypothetical protein